MSQEKGDVGAWHSVFVNVVVEAALPNNTMVFICYITLEIALQRPS